MSDKFQFVELNGRLMWCDFGANLVQHFIGRYSRYSRYQTVLSKLQEIITALRQLFRYTKSSAMAGLFVLREGEPLPYEKEKQHPRMSAV